MKKKILNGAIVLQNIEGLPKAGALILMVAMAISILDTLAVGTGLVSANDGTLEIVSLIVAALGAAPLAAYAWHGIHRRELVKLTWTKVILIAVGVWVLSIPESWSQLTGWKGILQAIADVLNPYVWWAYGILAGLKALNIASNFLTPKKTRLSEVAGFFMEQDEVITVARARFYENPEDNWRVDVDTWLRYAKTRIEIWQEEGTLEENLEKCRAALRAAQSKPIY